MTSCTSYASRTPTEPTSAPRVRPALLLLLLLPPAAVRETGAGTGLAAAHPGRYCAEPPCRLRPAPPFPPPHPRPATHCCCLPPAAGEYNLRLGVMKELRPDMVATHQGSIGVHEGHAFVVEAAVSVGGKNIKPGLNIHRFANRIPLLFEVRCGAG